MSVKGRDALQLTTKVCQERARHRIIRTMDSPHATNTATVATLFIYVNYVFDAAMNCLCFSILSAKKEERRRIDDSARRLPSPYYCIMNVPQLCWLLFYDLVNVSAMLVSSGPSSSLGGGGR